MVRANRDARQARPEARAEGVVVIGSAGPARLVAAGRGGGRLNGAARGGTEDVAGATPADVADGRVVLGDGAVVLLVEGHDRLGGAAVGVASTAAARVEARRGALRGGPVLRDEGGALRLLGHPEDVARAADAGVRVAASLEVRLRLGDGVGSHVCCG